MKPISLCKKMERGCRIPNFEGAFVELLNKEMEELLKSIGNNKELNKFNENNSTNSKGVENEQERN